MKNLLIVYLHNDMPTNVKRQMLRFRDNGNFDGLASKCALQLFIAFQLYERVDGLLDFFVVS